MKIPKCKICGGPHYQYQCWSNPKRRKYALKRKYSQYKAGLTPKMDKVLSSQSLNRKRIIIDLDTYCSKYVRLKAANTSGIATCYTCGKQLPWKMMDCGHYRSRQHLQTRFDLNDLRPQCLTSGHKVGGKDVSQIKVGDRIPSLYGETKVIGAKSFVSPILKIWHEKGVIKCSPEHKVLVEVDKKRQWVKAKDLLPLIERQEAYIMMI